MTILTVTRTWCAVLTTLVSIVAVPLLIPSIAALWRPDVWFRDLAIVAIIAFMPVVPMWVGLVRMLQTPVRGIGLMVTALCLFAVEALALSVLLFTGTGIFSTVVASLTVIGVVFLGTAGLVWRAGRAR